MTVEENIKFGLMMKKVPADEQRNVLLRSFILPSSKSSATAVPSKCPADSSSVSQLPALWSTIPRSSYWTSLWARWITSCAKSAAGTENLQRGLGLTFIYVTHDQEEALTMSDRIVVMNKGVIEQDDNPDNIYHYPSTKFVAKFIGESNFFDTETETLALRPEKLNLCEEAESEDKAAAHPEPAFYGTVVDVVFYGTIDKVFVRLDNSNQTVVAYQYFDDVKRWTPDERVGIWWYERDEVKVQR